MSFSRAQPDYEGFLLVLRFPLPGKSAHVSVGTSSIGMIPDVAFKPRINWMRSQEIDFDVKNQKFKNYLVLHLASLELEEDFKQHKIKITLTVSSKELV